MKNEMLFVISSLHLLDVTVAEMECRDMNGRTVSQGSHYVQGPDTCTLCICDNGEPKWCKAVLCSPPQHCKSFRVGNSCCEFICLDDTLSSDNPPDLGFKLVAGSIATIIFLSILLIMVHRLRQRKLRLNQHRQQNEDQRSLASIGYIDGTMGYMGAMCDDGHINYPVWKPPGNYFPRGEAPPPYDEAVAQARAEAVVRISNEPQIGFHRSFSASHATNIGNVRSNDTSHLMPLRNQQLCSGPNMLQASPAPILASRNIAEQHFGNHAERQAVRNLQNASLMSVGNQAMINPVKLSQQMSAQAGAVPRGSLGRSAGEGVFLRMLPAAYIPIGNSNSLTQHLTQMHRTIPRMSSTIDTEGTSQSSANMQIRSNTATLDRRRQANAKGSGTGIENQYETSAVNTERQNSMEAENGTSHHPSSRTLGKLMGLFSEIQPDKTDLPLIVDKPLCGCSYDCDPPPLTDDVDDYHSECENCKSSSGSRYYLDDCEEEVDEGTMTLQRHITTTAATPNPASATLPGSTKQRHRSASMLGELLPSWTVPVILIWTYSVTSGWLLIPHTAALGAFATFIYCTSTCTFDYWSRRGVKGPRAIPFLGNIKNLATLQQDIGSLFKEFYDSFPKERFIGVYQTLIPTLVVREPALIKRMCVQDHAHFADRGFFFDLNVDPLCENVLFATGSHWKKLRSKLTPTFSPSKLKGMVHLVEDTASRLSQALTSKDGAAVEAGGALGRYTGDAVLRCAFGVDCDSFKDPDNEFVVATERFYNITPWSAFQQFMRLFWPSFVLFFRMRHVPRETSDFFSLVVGDVMAARQSGARPKRGDMIDLMMQLRRPENGASGNNNEGELDINEKIANDGFVLTDNMIAANAFVMYLGGHETSSTTLTFCLLELALRPELQLRLRQEVLEVGVRHQGHITYDTLQEMHYMEMVIQETLRLYPPFQNIQRLCTKDYAVPDSDLVIEKGTTVIFPVFGIQRDPKYFPDPDQFNPERFSEENKDQIVPATYMPFGDGPRYCIGQRFASVQMKMCLVKLFQEFSVEPALELKRPFALDPRSVTIRVQHSLLRFIPLPVTENT